MFDRLPDWLRTELTAFVKYDGLPLGAVREIMNTQGLEAELFCGSQVSESMLRGILEEAAESDNMYVLLNVGRRALGQRGDGHFFLLGGIHRESDRALLLEVNTWRYPSVWARVPELHASVQTTTMSGQPRGFLVVRRADDAHAETTLNGVKLQAEVVGQQEPTPRAGAIAEPLLGWAPRDGAPLRVGPRPEDFEPSLEDFALLHTCAVPCEKPCRVATC
jgi:hypothetical protein